ncbi:MAG: glycosyltransferase [Candidatus Paceibacterota bacterium]|jgi:spore maturation protein CgeB
MKVLYAGMQKENYDSKNRDSFEYINFFLTLKAMPGVEVFEHPFDRILEVGKKNWNIELFEIIKKEKPELLFVFMYTDELETAILEKIRNTTTTKSIAWFADDYWRFWNYSKNWASHFDWVVTTYSRAVEWYQKKGLGNILLSQWACNTNNYKSLNLQKGIDVSFIGQYKSGRAKVIKQLKKVGISVETYGFGWPNGKISQEKMIEIFSRSKINLNINARPGLLHPKVVSRIFFRKSINRIKVDLHLVDNLMAYFHFPIHHTHARPFELAGCGSFVISGYSEDIDKYYRNGEEMVFYKSPDDLAEKIKYYLSHSEEREKIAVAGYKRTICEHTYQARFMEIFKKIGLNL